jgi:hypothetical protein
MIYNHLENPMQATRPFPIQELFAFDTGRPGADSLKN